MWINIECIYFKLIKKNFLNFLYKDKNRGEKGNSDK